MTTDLICAVCGAHLDPADALPDAERDGTYYHANPAWCQAHIDWTARKARAIAFLRQPRARWQAWGDLKYDYQQEDDHALTD